MHSRGRPPLSGYKKGGNMHAVAITITKEQFEFIEKSRNLLKRSTFIQQLLDLGIEKYKEGLKK